MPGFIERRVEALLRRGSGVITERDWERSAVLEPRAAPADPELVSDGIGLPFPPAALTAPARPLPRDDDAVQVLAGMLAAQKAPAESGRVPPLDAWRMLARTEDEALFGYGRPPKLVTITLRRGSRREGWTSLGVTRDVRLRTTRDGIRASGWRLDPSHELDPTDTILRVLVTEQTRSGGKRADGRLLAPDLHIGPAELVLTMFVTPRPGIQMASAVVDTAARVQLPEPIGERDLCDGALLDLGSE